MPPSNIDVFIDTNVFYDVYLFDQIKWREDVFPGNPEIRILIVPFNFQELNDHKDSGRKPLLKDRIASTIRFLDDQAAKSDDDFCVVLRPGVTLQFIPESAPLVTGASSRANDNQLIADILLHQSQNPQARVVLLTHDTGMKLLARAKKIECCVAPAKYIAPPPSDPKDKEKDKRIALLEQKLAEFENRAPKLIFMYEDGSTALTRSSKPVLGSGYIEKRMREERDSHPPIGNGEIIPYSGRKLTLRDLISEGKSYEGLNSQNFDYDGYSEQTAILYNTELYRYFTDLERYLKDNIQMLDKQQRQLGLSFCLGNEGTIPAQDIDISLYFPPGFTVTDTENELPFPAWPSPPVRPKPGKSFADSYQANRTFRSIPYYAIPSPNESFLNRPWVSEQDIHEETEVTYHLKRLKQKMKAVLEPVYVLPPIDAEGHIIIGGRINTSELPSSIEFQLDLHLQSEAWDS